MPETSPLQHHLQLDGETLRVLQNFVELTIALQESVTETSLYLQKISTWHPDPEYVGRAADPRIQEELDSSLALLQEIFGNQSDLSLGQSTTDHDTPSLTVYSVNNITQPVLTEPFVALQGLLQASAQPLIPTSVRREDF